VHVSVRTQNYCRVGRAEVCAASRRLSLLEGKSNSWRSTDHELTRPSTRDRYAFNEINGSPADCNIGAGRSRRGSRKKSRIAGDRSIDCLRCCPVTKIRYFLVLDRRDHRYRWRTARGTRRLRPRTTETHGHYVRIEIRTNRRGPHDTRGDMSIRRGTLDPRTDF